MKNKWIILLCIAAVAAGPAFGQPSRRVISLSPAATELLFAVGASVVGNTTYCTYPAEALEVTKIGGFSAESMSIEKILSLRPDLVVSSGKIHQTVTDEIAKYGIRIYVYAPKNFDEIARGIIEVGILTGNEARARQEAKKLLDKIDGVRKVVAAIPVDQRPTVFWEVYDQPLMTCGPTTFQHAIVETAGGRNIFGDLKTDWPMVSSEEVVARAPQVIMGADDHGENFTVKAISARPGWSTIPAVRNMRIIYLPTALVSGEGPRIAEGVYLAAKALYPRLFP